MISRSKTPTSTAPAAQEADWLTAQVKKMFDDPRFKHLQGLADADDRDGVGSTDPALFMQAAIGLYTIQSAEEQSAALVKVTRGLSRATFALVLATVVLVGVTLVHG